MPGKLGFPFDVKSTTVHDVKATFDNCWQVHTPTGINRARRRPGANRIKENKIF